MEDDTQQVEDSLVHLFKEQEVPYLDAIIAMANVMVNTVMLSMNMKEDEALSVLASLFANHRLKNAN